MKYVKIKKDLKGKILRQTCSTGYFILKSVLLRFLTEKGYIQKNVRFSRALHTYLLNKHIVNLFTKLVNPQTPPNLK